MLLVSNRIISVPDEAQVLKELKELGVSESGCYIPSDCIIRQHLLVVVPYRNRAWHLFYFAYNIHKFLITQRRAYCLVISEQYDKGPFNRAKLMNTGYIQGIQHFSDKTKRFADCVVFTDVDLIPDKLGNLHACDRRKAIHLCDKVRKYSYRTQFITGSSFSSGGSFIVHKLRYQSMNGHPNWYWGWGFEDHDMSKRLSRNGIDIFNTDKNWFKNDSMDTYLQGVVTSYGSYHWGRQDKYGYYTNLMHEQNAYNRLTKALELEIPAGLTLARFNHERQFSDGLTSTYFDLRETYQKDHMYTKFKFEIRPAVPVKILLKLSGVTGYDFAEGNNSKCEYKKIKNVRSDGRWTPYNSTAFDDIIRNFADACDKIDRDNGQCSLISDRCDDGECRKLNVPYPLKTVYDHFQVFRHCPQMTNSPQLVEEDVKKSSNFEISLELELKTLEKPTDVMYYGDRFLREGYHFDGELFEFSIPTVKNEVEFETDKNLMVIDRGANSLVKISIRRNFKANQLTAGFYYGRSVIMDAWGQPYFDFIYMFRVTNGDTDVDKLEISQYQSMKNPKFEISGIDYMKNAKQALKSHTIFDLKE